MDVLIGFAMLPYMWHAFHTNMCTGMRLRCLQKRGQNDSCCTGLSFFCCQIKFNEVAKVCKDRNCHYFTWLKWILLSTISGSIGYFCMSIKTDGTVLESESEKALADQLHALGVVMVILAAQWPAQYVFKVVAFSFS